MLKIMYRPLFFLKIPLSKYKLASVQEANRFGGFLNLLMGFGLCDYYKCLFQTNGRNLTANTRNS